MFLLFIGKVVIFIFFLTFCSTPSLGIYPFPHQNTPQRPSHLAVCMSFAVFKLFLIQQFLLMRLSYYLAPQNNFIQVWSIPSWAFLRQTALLGSNWSHIAELMAPVGASPVKETRVTQRFHWLMNQFTNPTQSWQKAELWLDWWCTLTQSLFKEHVGRGAAVVKGIGSQHNDFNVEAHFVFTDSIWWICWKAFF